MTTSLSVTVEDLISCAFYAKDGSKRREKAYAYGLQSPLWFWSFCNNSNGSIDAKDIVEKEQVRLLNLVRWLVLSKRKEVSIALVVPLQWQTLMRQKVVLLLGEITKALFGSKLEEEAEFLATRENALHVEVLAHHELSIRRKRRQHMHSFVSNSASITDKEICSVERSYKLNYDVVLFSFGFPPCIEHLNQVISQEENLRDAVQASLCSFILSADIGWTSNFVFSRWKEWKVFSKKLMDEPLPISVSLHHAGEACKEASFPHPQQGGERNLPSEEDKLPHLVGKAIPLCCSAHPNQRKLDYGTSSITLQCARLCLQPFGCGQSNHLCKELCHISTLLGNLHSRQQCPFRCDKVMQPCGHKCLKECSSRCDCFQIVEVPLPCFHHVALGLDAETGETVYGRVDHIFKGSCANVSSSCQVEYTSECATCSGPLQVLCYEAQEMHHTLSNRTITCASCQRWTRELRAELLGSLLCEVEQNRKRLRIELVQSLHEQQKAAKRGLFLPGERVEIVDSTKCVAPLFEDDFQNVKFLSMDECDFFSKTQGAYGTFVSSHVDTIDLTQIRNLVQLPSGLHVLVTDDGLKLIRPVTKLFLKNAKKLYLTYEGNNTSPAAVGSFFENSSKMQYASMLFIEEGNGSTGMKEETFPNEAAAKEFLRLYCGKAVYLPTPISVALSEVDGDEKVFTDCFATVLGLASRAEGTNPAAMIEVTTYTAGALLLGSGNRSTVESSLCGFSDNSDSTSQRKYQDIEENNIKEENAEDPELFPTYSSSLSVRTEILDDGLLCKTSYSFSTFISQLEPTDGFERNKCVYVLGPEHQVRETYALHLITIAARKEFQLKSIIISSARLQADTPYTVVGLLNPPHLGEGYRPLNPLVILSKSFFSSTTKQFHGRHSLISKGSIGRKNEEFSAKEVNSEALPSLLYFAIPFMFTKCDEEAKCEAALDQSSRKAFETLFETKKASKSEDICLRNEERTFRKLEQLAPVSEEARAQVRKTYSIPVPIPEAEVLASINQRYLAMPTASPTQCKALHLRDAFEKKKEQMMLGGKWKKDFVDRIALDNSADASHVSSIDIHFSKKAYKLPQSSSFNRGDSLYKVKV